MKRQRAYNCVAPLVHDGTAGAWYRRLRLAALDGSSLNLPDEARNRKEFGLPGVVDQPLR